MKTAGGNEIRPGSFKKIVQRGDVVYGITGAAALFEPLIHWCEAGADPAAVPKDRDDQCSNLFVFRDGKCFVYTTDLSYPEELTAPDAFGSGGDYALGAMHAGADAKRAVEVACKIDPHSGGEITVIDLSFQVAKPDISPKRARRNGGLEAYLPEQ
jgi:hypothetical protein